MLLRLLSRYLTLRPFSSACQPTHHVKKDWGINLPQYPRSSDFSIEHFTWDSEKGWRPSNFLRVCEKEEIEMNWGTRELSAGRAWGPWLFLLFWHFFLPNQWNCIILPPHHPRFSPFILSEVALPRILQGGIRNRSLVLVYFSTYFLPYWQGLVRERWDVLSLMKTKLLGSECFPQNIIVP